VIDGLIGDQRFFMSFRTIFRGKTRDNEAIMRIKLVPHSPEEVAARYRSELGSFL